MATATQEELALLRRDMQGEISTLRGYADGLHVELQQKNATTEVNFDNAAKGFTAGQKRLNEQLNDMRSAMEALDAAIKEIKSTVGTLDTKFTAVGAGKLDQVATALATMEAN